MKGDLLALGASHKTAPLALREKLALPAGRAARVLAELTDHDGVHEAVALFTCNRTELYLVTADAVEAENAALGDPLAPGRLRPTELLGSLYSLRGREAVEHLFSVTAGLDSMIVGEAEIQGQVKRAYEMALVEGVSGPVSNRLFRDALAAGKRVRTETGVARSNVSISTVAVQLAADFLGELADRRVLVIGAGENAELTARALRDRGVHTLFVANRRYDRALGLAQSFGGRAVTFEDMPRELEAADIVVSSTGAPHQIVGREELEFVAASRMGRPLVLIDLAVPRDIEPSVRDCPGIALYDMDDLQRAVARNLDAREAEAEEALVLVRQDVERFERWLATSTSCPRSRPCASARDEVVRQVLDENEPRWETLSEADRERARGDGAGGRLPPAARADGAAEGSAASYPYAVTRCASCSGSTPRRPEDAPAAEVTRLAPRRRSPPA